MSAAPVLVVGNYPPVETAAAPATLDAVRRIMADGREPIVVSPRYCAAHRTAPVDGLLSGPCIRALRRQTGAQRVVLSAEPGMPVHPGAGPLGRLDGLVTCLGVAWALRGFKTATVIENGFRGDDVPGWSLVRRAAAEVVERPDATGTPGIRPTLGGTDEAEQRRLLARMVAKRALGPAAPVVGRIGRGLARRAPGR